MKEFGSDSRKQVKRKTEIAKMSDMRCILFPSAIGWNVVFHSAPTIHRVRIGFPKQVDAIEQVRILDAEVVADFEHSAVERQWIDSFSRYFEGEVVDFSKFEIDQSWMTCFQRKCVDACRGIAYGRTESYGSVARKVNSPGAARAVGTVMRTNRYPIIVPCHRVVAASGIGGFSAPAGVHLKRQLLQMEERG